MGNNAIEVEHLVKQYGEITVLDDVSFQVANGEIFGFLGHNGAGKTSTVNILTTLLPPTSGNALVAGHDIGSASMNVRQCIGYVPENVQLYGNLTAYENLEFFARLSGVSDVKGAIAETLLFLNADGYAHRKIEELSKGMRQRIGLAQAILHKPKVLFLDEPTSGLDPVGIKQFRDICIRLNKDTGMTIFMNTHLLSEVAKMCDTIGILTHGKLVYVDNLKNTLKQFKDEESLEHIYLSIESNDYGK